MLLIPPRSMKMMNHKSVKLWKGRKKCTCLLWSSTRRKLGPQFVVKVVHDRHEQKREMCCTRKHCAHTKSPARALMQLRWSHHCNKGWLIRVRQMALFSTTPRQWHSINRYLGKWSLWVRGHLPLSYPSYTENINNQGLRHWSVVTGSQGLWPLRLLSWWIKTNKT